MKLSNNGTGSKLRPAVLCGVLSLLTDFILIPHVLTLMSVIGCPVPDPIWIPMMILIPVILAIRILERKARIPARYVWVGLLVQYLILIVFAKPMYKIIPLASDEWTYIGTAMVWPFSVTAAQFVFLIALRAWKGRRRG